MDDEFYRFDICTECLWRAGYMTHLCDACDEGDQFEEDDEPDDHEPDLKAKPKVIRILEIA